MRSLKLVGVNTECGLTRTQPTCPQNTPCSLAEWGLNSPWEQCSFGRLGTHLLYSCHAGLHGQFVKPGLADPCPLLPRSCGWGVSAVLGRGGELRPWAAAVRQSHRWGQSMVPCEFGHGRKLPGSPSGKNPNPGQISCVCLHWGCFEFFLVVVVEGFLALGFF